MEFNKLQAADLKGILKIYNYYVLKDTATFHTEQLSLDDLRQMIPMGEDRYQTYVMKEAGQVVGYGYYGRYKNRKAYDRTAEVSIYIHPDARHRGYGIACLNLLEDEARKAGISVLIGVISAENSRSVRLFEKQGFEKCAHLKGVGEKFNRILDVVFFQKNL
ncbi:MAG: N-acetyltransferase [Bacteroidales bacterium]|nr:N-acetyltransferase [Bacteroidales bacterium]